MAGYCAICLLNARTREKVDKRPEYFADWLTDLDTEIREIDRSASVGAAHYERHCDQTSGP